MITPIYSIEFCKENRDAKVSAVIEKYLNDVCLTCLGGSDIFIP